MRLNGNINFLNFCVSKPILVLLSVIIFQLDLYSQVIPCYNNSINYSTFSMPKDFEVEDFNNDGIQDVVILRSSNLGIRLGINGGGYQYAIDTNLSALDITSGFFNSGGNRDLILAEGSNIYVLAGNGDGTFTLINNIQLNSSVNNLISVESTDLNNDGKIDIVFSDNLSNNLLVYLGNGLGGFTSSQVIPINNIAACIRFSDFNNDSKIDIAVLQGSSSISILLGNGSGNFTLTSTVACSSSPGFDLADINNDGIVDLVTCNSNNGVSILYLGSGNGTFTSLGSQSFNNSTNYILLKDLNYDGNIDLVGALGNSFSGSLKFFAGNGNGTFSPSISILLSSTIGYLPIKIVMKDLDNDGGHDLITLNQANNSFSVVKECTPVSISNADLYNTFSVYPNPASGKIFFRINENNFLKNHELQKEMYDVFGRKVFQSYKDEMNVSDMPRGIYYIKISGAIKKVVLN
ncbi:MAG: T9SS type A sorting domain-containing protein [Chitinophagaceae bacterium]|nr:T9SS type A sorting domain-containing protein [Chitinophagaceae bacterium]